MDLTNLTNLTHKHKNKIFHIVIIIFALMIANNIHQSQVRNIRLLMQKKDAEIKKNALLENINQSEKKLNALKEVINNKDISLIPHKLNSMAGDSGVKITLLKPQKPRDYLTYVNYLFELVMVSPDYHRIGKFISKLEKAAEIYRVEEINIRPVSEPQKQGQDDKLTAALRLSTCLIKDGSFAK